MRAALIALLLTALAGAAAAQSLGTLTRTRTNDVLQLDARSKDALVWFERQTLTYRVAARTGSAVLQISTNVVPMWYATDASLTNRVLTWTGVVEVVSNAQVAFTLPRAASLTAGTYQAIAMLFDGNPATNPPSIVIDRTDLQVLWSPAP